MTSKAVVFKGTRGGLNIFIDPLANWSDIKEAVLLKLTAGRPFFDGVAVNLTFIGREFSESEQQALTTLTASYIQTGTIEFNKNTDTQQSVPTEDQFESFDGIEEGMTRFVKGTVRNGQRISYEGNVVVIGDVNPGGEIIAGGNILILGTLRGLAHAGADGNQEAIVVAYCLQPTQLRVAGIITRAPEGESTRPSYPEIVYIKNGTLMIEPYLRGKGK